MGQITHAPSLLRCSMYEIEMTLNEPVEEIILLHVGDAPILEVTLYDWDGTAWDSGYDAFLMVGLSGADIDEWQIDESDCVPFAENVFCFQLEAITFTTGNYTAIVHVHVSNEATPLATPDDASYSFKAFQIEVK